MAPGGVIGRQRSRRAFEPIRAERSSNGSWRSHPALLAKSSPHFNPLRAFRFLLPLHSSLSSLGLGFLLPRGYFRRFSCCSAGLLRTPYGSPTVKRRVTLRVQVFLEIFYWLALTFAKAPDPFGSRGRWPWRALRWCVPPWPGCTFTAVVQNNDSRGRHHSSSFGRDAGETCARVSFKPEWTQS